MSSSVPAKKLPAQDFSTEASQPTRAVSEAVPFPNAPGIEPFEPIHSPESLPGTFSSFCAVNLSGSENPANSKHARLQEYLDTRNGRFAWIPAGRHRIRRPLVIRHSMHIIMEPDTVLLLSPGDRGASDFEGEEWAPLFVVTADGVTIEGGQLEAEKTWRWWEQDKIDTVGIQVLAANFELKGTSVRGFEIGFHILGTAGDSAIDGRWRPGLVLDNKIGMLFNYTLDTSKPEVDKQPWVGIQDGWVDEHVIIGGDFRWSDAVNGYVKPDAETPQEQLAVFLSVQGAQTNGIKFFGTSFDAAGLGGTKGAFFGTLYGEGTHFYGCRIANTFRVYYQAPPEPQPEFVNTTGSWAAVDDVGSRGNAVLYPVNGVDSTINIVDKSKGESTAHVTWLTGQLYVQSLETTEKQPETWATFKSLR